MRDAYRGTPLPRCLPPEAASEGEIPARKLCRVRREALPACWDEMVSANDHAQRAGPPRPGGAGLLLQRAGNRCPFFADLTRRQRGCDRDRRRRLRPASGAQTSECPEQEMALRGRREPLLKYDISLLNGE